jgi:hypothetical protein
MKQTTTIATFGRTLICALAMGALVVSGTALAETAAKGSAQGTAKVAKEVQKKTKTEAGKQRDTIIKEAVAALAQTKKAILALEKKDKQAALDALAMVTGKLDIIIAREPDMANAPIDVRGETYDLISSVDMVKKAVKTAQDLLDDGEVQQAREIMIGLVDEIDLIVTAIPLASYSDGIKAVAKLVDEEKYEEAQEAIYELLSTLVVTRNVIPLPILRAEELLKKADELATKKNRSEEENKKLAALLSDTRSQIKMAEVLGYGDKSQYKEFYRQIKEIEKKTENGKFGKGFMDKLKKSLADFKAKIFGESAAAKKADTK